MAIVFPSSLIGSASGTFGDLVLRRYRGKTVLQRRPVFTQPRTAGQLKTQRRFKAASDFAARIALDPGLRAQYAASGRRKGRTYREVAMSDFFHPPQISGIRWCWDAAGPDATLVIAAYDNFEVVRVSAAFHAVDGAVLGTVDAAPVFLDWHCRVPVGGADSPAPVRVVVTAWDRPGNATTREFPLPRPTDAAWVR